MDTKDIYCFLMLSQTEDIDQAAVQAGVSSGRMAQALQALQEEAGYPLIEQEGARCRLTSAGREFLTFARTVESALQSFCGSVYDRPSVPPSVSLSLNACSSLLTPIFSGFKAAHPEIELRITQYAASEERCDFYIVTEKVPPKDTNALLLLKEDLNLQISEKHPLASRKSVGLSELANERFIVPSRENPLREIVEESCRSVGLQPKIAVETNSNLTYTRLLPANQAVALIPSRTSSTVVQNGCVTLKISDPPVCRYLVLRWDEDTKIDPARRAVQEYLLNFFKTLPGPEEKAVIRTFGRFDLLVKNKPVYFSSKKAKELLALLVDRQGGLVTMEQAVDCLWEDEPYDEKIKRRYRSAVIALRDTLKKYHLEPIVTFQRAGAYLNKNEVSCDLFEFFQTAPGAATAFNGEYMLDYSWGEHTLPLLNRRNQEE